MERHGSIQTASLSQIFRNKIPVHDKGLKKSLESQGFCANFLYPIKFKELLEDAEQKTMVKLTSVKVNLKLPYIGGVEGNWAPDEDEKKASWEMYVELVTRISVVELKPDEGMLREALNSLYSLFETTRKILRKYGPTVAQPKGKDNLSFGYIAVVILNVVLRPNLAKWHPLLLNYENQRTDSLPPLDYEKRWEKHEELRQVLNEIRSVLIKYSNLLAEVAEVPSLIFERKDQEKDAKS